jgi:hypothetical protein
MQHFTADDGVTIANDTWGTPSDRPSVLLHHGFVAGAASSGWRATTSAPSATPGSPPAWSSSSAADLRTRAPCGHDS